MKRIICKACGEVPYYTNFDVQKIYICFDPDGKEIDPQLEEFSLRSSAIPRCPKCDRKVKIVEDKDGKENG